MEIIPYEDDVFADNFGLRIWEKREAFVLRILSLNGCKSIIDFGCGKGTFLKKLTRDIEMKNIIGVEKEIAILNQTKERLQPDLYDFSQKYIRMHKLNIKLYQNDILNKIKDFQKMDFDALTLIEVIEHLNYNDLDNLNSNVFGFLNPKLVIITTPNYDFNYFFNKTQEFNNEIRVFRNIDHRFEFTRNEFERWCNEICLKFYYDVEFNGVGLPKNGDVSKGYSTQIAIFLKKNNHEIKYFTEENEILKKENANLFFEIDYPIDFNGKLKKRKIKKKGYVVNMKKKIFKLKNQNVDY